MRVATKLSGAFGLLVLLFIGLLVYHVRTVRHTVATSYELSEISSRFYLTSAELLGRISGLEENASKFWVTGDEGYLALFREASSGIESALRDLDALELDPEERAELEGLTESWVLFRPLADGLVSLAGESPDSLEVAFDKLDDLRMGAQALSLASRAVMTQRLTRSAEVAGEAERISWGAGALALLLSLLVAGLIVRSISRALVRLKAGTNAVASGDFEYRMQTSPADEFAEVARDFNGMTQRLGELDRMKRDFVSKISHDLKGPLASIRETGSLLLDEVPGPLRSEQRELLTLSQESGSQLASMIAKILDLSALEAGAFEPVRLTHDLGSLVVRSVDQMRPVAEGRGLEARVSVPDRVLLVECDAELIRQVVVNLIENAFKFSPDRGVVRIGLRFVTVCPEEVPASRWQASEEGSGVGRALLKVCDEGPGIGDEDWEAVFEPFFQGERGRRVPGRGVGLGLTICREIVRGHGGEIWAEDGDPHGAVVRVLLPGALLLPAPDEAGRPSREIHRVHQEVP